MITASGAAVFTPGSRLTGSWTDSATGVSTILDNSCLWIYFLNPGPAGWLDGTSAFQTRCPAPRRRWTTTLPKQ